MISDKYKCIFIHIPKCAGTSIESKIAIEEGTENLLPDHRTILDMEPVHLKHIFSCSYYSIVRRTKYFFLRKKIGSFYKMSSQYKFDNYFKFSIVRNSWSRAYSWYRNVMNDYDHLKRYKISSQCSFENYLLNHIDSQKELRTQLYWLQDSNGNISLDFIGRFENIDTDFIKIAQIIGLSDVELPKKRYTGKSFTYIDAYNDTTKDLLWKRYKKEIDYFRFEFGE